MKKRSSQKKAIEKAVARIGGQSETGRLVGKPQGSVWNWINVTGRCPAELVLKISEASGVPPHELRPDIYPAPAEAGAAE